MIIYAGAVGLYPIVGMQVLMLPVNIYRLMQMRALLLRVSQASAGSFRPDALLPFMDKERHADGDVLFRKGDDSHKLYLIREGRVRLVELGHLLEPGQMLGEIGILSDSNRRTATAVCEGEVKLHSITREDVTQLFFQNPEFGFFLMRLVTDRLLANQSTQAAEPSQAAIE
jgi:CRP-like cAMP-binding protein